MSVDDVTPLTEDDLRSLERGGPLSPAVGKALADEYRARRASSTLRRLADPYCPCGGSARACKTGGCSAGGAR